MIKRKSMRSKGKLKLSQYFQVFKEGDKVAIVREQSLNPAFPVRIQGRVGTITGKRGGAYIVKLIEGSQEKNHIIAPIHLKRTGEVKI